MVFRPARPFVVDQDARGRPVQIDELPPAQRPEKGASPINPMPSAIGINSAMEVMPVAP
jgi:hypothetical protein